MILFSIAVHEQPQVILNQVKNFKFFNPDCIIVLHFSAAMPQEEFEKACQLLRGIQGVHLNTKRLWSGYGDGTQMKMHVLNYTYAKNIGLDFQYFCMHASNDMFVKFGLSSFIQNYDAGFHVPTFNKETRWVHLERAEHDWRLKKMLKKYKLSKILGAQIEGSFYRRAIIDQVMNRIIQDAYSEIPRIYTHGESKLANRLLNNQYLRALLRRLAKGFLYAKEEIYFPTLSQDLIQHSSPFNYCYINWQNKLNITIEDIKKVIANQYEDLSFYRKIDFSQGNISFFAVKRVDRKMSDPIRIYINSLQQNA